MKNEHEGEFSAANVNPSEPEEEFSAELEEVDVGGSGSGDEIVLVKSKKLAWPAIVQSREDNMVEVKMIHDDKIKIVANSDVEEFDISKIANSKNSRLKQAFAKAANLMKK